MRLQARRNALRTLNFYLFSKWFLSLTLFPLTVLNVPIALILKQLPTLPRLQEGFPELVGQCGASGPQGSQGAGKTPPLEAAHLVSCEILTRLLMTLRALPSSPVRQGSHLSRSFMRIRQGRGCEMSGTW